MNWSYPGQIADTSSSARPLAAPILKLIWDEERISRAEIARQMGHSRSTVTEAVRDLLKTGLIQEQGTGEATGGRKPIILEFQNDACFILGVDIGATHVAVALTNLRGQVLQWEHRSFNVREDPIGTRALALELCEICRHRQKGLVRNLVGVGVGLPCPVDTKQEGRISEIVMPQWQGKSGLELLSDQYRRPVLQDNDANLGTLAEHWWGAGRGVHDFAYIKVATGIGLGHILDGKIYRGASGVAGEIGHLAIDPNGRECVCGLKGCLTTYVGSAAIVSRALRLLADYPETSLKGTPFTIEDIEGAALEGDELAIFVIQEAAEYLGITMAGLLNLNNPSKILLGGGITRVGNILFAPLRETINMRTLVSSTSSTDIIPAELGEQSVALGAATLVLEAAFKEPSMFPRWPRKDY